MTSNKSGFTLIEVLTATVISSIIIIAVYSIFNSITKVQADTTVKNDFNLLKNKLTILLNEDINSSVNIKTESDDIFDVKFTIVTFNSLFFNHSIPVTVVYTLQDGFLIRSEINKKLDFRQDIRLIPGIKNFEVLYYNGNEYTDTESDSSIFKFNVETADGKFQITAGKLLL